MKLSTALSTAFVVSLSACVQQPADKATDAGKSVPLAKRYDASAPPVPEITNSLKSLFPSSNLNAYINKAISNNPDLKAAQARLEEAGFNTRKSQAGLLPTLTGNAAATRSRTNSAGSSFNTAASSSGRYTASLDAQWEVDIWGRIRSGIAATSLTRQAVLADYAAARQSIAAQTAQAYFDLVATQKLSDLADRRFNSFQKTYNLVNRRFESGTSNLGEVELARTDLENARSTVANRTDARDQASRRLATLTGTYPDAKRTASTWPSLTRSVHPGIPSTLLMNRPDIDAAYQRIRAADANVTVAHRDLYPSFSLTASTGQQSSSLKKLADSNFNVWSLATNLSAPILDGGNRRAELGAANARAKQALANYQSVVLSALQEVENALGSEQFLLKQQQATSSALQAAIRAEDRVLRTYENGTVEILTLLDTQRRRFTAEESLINITNLRYQNRVSLALALGKAY